MIKSHNNRILSKDNPKCNCQQKDTCSLEGNCSDKELIHHCNLKEDTTSIGVNYNKRFTNILSTTRVRKIPQTYQSISGKWEGKTTKTQSCTGQWMIMPNHIRMGQKGATFKLCMQNWPSWFYTLEVV